MGQASPVSWAFPSFSWVCSLFPKPSSFLLSLPPPPSLSSALLPSLLPFSTPFFSSSLLFSSPPCPIQISCLSWCCSVPPLGSVLGTHVSRACALGGDCAGHHCRPARRRPCAFSILLWQTAAGGLCPHGCSPAQASRSRRRELPVLVSLFIQFLLLAARPELSPTLLTPSR